jgi:hypothetical protein
MRRSRLQSVSRKRRALGQSYGAFVVNIHDLDGWRCQACVHLGPGPSWCGPLDVHHTRKPRALFLMDPEYAISLGRRHHELCEAPYATGRLVITGTRSQGWDMSIVTAEDKFAYRAAGVEPRESTRA